MSKSIATVVLTAAAIVCAACASQPLALATAEEGGVWQVAVYPQVDDDGNAMPEVVVGDP